MSTKDDLTRDTYAHFGLAIFQAQILEIEIVTSMVIAMFPKKDLIGRQGISTFMDQQSTYTLGKLLQELKKYASVSDELEQILKEALEKRNWLVHYYFKERAEEFMSSAGCNLMISELEGAQQIFGDATHTLNTSVKPIRGRFGLTDEVIDREVERQMVEHGDWIS